MRQQGLWLLLVVMGLSGCTALSNGVKSGTQAVTSQQSSGSNLKHTECHETLPGHVQCDEY